jgi:beta-aspartyl-dipeptidase (metallo-type)
VLAPEPLGKKSVLLWDGRIAKICDPGEIDRRALEALGLELEVVDAAGCSVTPGLVDPHEHLIGGSGEEGYASRSPEIQLSELVPNGITTVVGCLGLDATSRTHIDLLVKVRGLDEEGITAFLYTGYYGIPPATITGSVRNDLVVVDKMIGVGEVAISDYRAPQPDPVELARLVIDAQAGGMLSGKAGVTHFHLGELPERLAPLWALIDEHHIRPELLYATHVNRTPELLSDAAKISRRGVWVDMDTEQDGLGGHVRSFLDQGGRHDRLSISSDADGNAPWRIWQQLTAAVRDDGFSLEEMLPLATAHPAEALKLEGKGRLEPGRDADVLVVRRESLEIVDVIAKGRVLFRRGKLVVRERFLEQSRRKLHLEGQKK